MIKSIHIFDFDGTLVDSSHRYRTQICADGVERIDLPHWIENEDKALNDTPLPLVARYRELCNDPAAFVIVATARIWCDLSRRFVELHDMKPQHVIARRDRNDTRGGAALKINGIRKLRNLRQFQNAREIHVYEDNINYLKTMCDTLGAVGHYFPSKQGH